MVLTLLTLFLLPVIETFDALVFLDFEDAVTELLLLLLLEVPLVRLNAAFLSGRVVHIGLIQVFCHILLLFFL